MSTGAGGPAAGSVTRRVVLLIAAHLVGGTSLLALHGGGPGSSSIAAILGFAAAYAVVGLVPLHLELRRHAHTITITEAVVVAAAFTLTPVGVAAAAVVGELATGMTGKLRPLQRGFNVAQTFGAASAAAVVLRAMGATDPTSMRGWVAGFTAAVVFASVSMVSVASVLAIVSSESFRRIVGVTSTSTAITGLASAALGLAVLDLARAAPGAPLLLAPVVALVVLESKRVTDASAERLRFERLYEASSRTARLSRVDEAVTVLGREARELLTGAQAMCCAQGDDGTWSGVIVDDDGSRALAPAAVAALVAVGARETVSLSWQRTPAALRVACDAEGDLVIAPSDPTSGVQVVLAVASPHGGDGRDRHLAEVLSAFAGTAALAVSNARLYAEVEAALLHQLDLNRQKAEFIAAVSHELRTPLASVLGSVQTIKRLGDRLPGPDRDELLEAALGQGARLRRLIEDLLLVAAAEHRTVHVARNPVDLAALLAELDDQFRGVDGGGRLRVRLHGPAGPGPLCTDAEKLARILTNLVENASKYAPDGPIEVDARRGEGRWVLTVADHGPGIPAAERERVFERFVQLDQSSTRRQGGTGLGLHLCRNVAELLGATLAVRGREDGATGAVFELVLPDAPPTPNAATASSATDAVPMGAANPRRHPAPAEATR